MLTLADEGGRVVWTLADKVGWQGLTNEGSIDKNALKMAKSYLYISEANLFFYYYNLDELCNFICICLVI